MKKLSNGRSLLITDVESLDDKVVSNWIPFVVLMTAWSVNAEKSPKFTPLIKYLLNKGAKTFICIGAYSEALHDVVDEVIYEYDETAGMDDTPNILTTYHDDESLEDSLNYFLHGTEVPNVEEGGLLALVSSENKQVLDHLARMAPS